MNEALNQALAAWESGEVSRSELIARFGDRAAPLTELHSKMMTMSEMAVPASHVSWQEVARRLTPTRISIWARMGLWLRRPLALGIAGAAVTGSVAFANPGVRHQVGAIWQHIGPGGHSISQNRLENADTSIAEVDSHPVIRMAPIQKEKSSDPANGSSRSHAAANHSAVSNGSSRSSSADQTAGSPPSESTQSAASDGAAATSTNTGSVSSSGGSDDSKSSGGSDGSGSGDSGSSSKDRGSDGNQDEQGSNGGGQDDQGSSDQNDDQASGSQDSGDGSKDQNSSGSGKDSSGSSQGDSGSGDGSSSEVNNQDS